MMTKYQTEKRKANVGERILITDAEWGQRYYKNGSIATVSDKKAWVSSILYVNEWEHSVHEEEYEVIVEQPKQTKNARITALETQVAALEAKVEALEKVQKYPLTARFDAETNAKADAILAEIKRKATPQTPNEQRADVIKRAKAFVSDWESKCGRKISYVVNAEKRTVVALKHRMFFGIEGGVFGRGIAKCDPEDVFNADIGKAIALARALGVEVLDEFVKAVQPTEVVVGHKLTLKDTRGNEQGGTVSHFKTIHGEKCAMFEGYGGASLESADGKSTLPRITDDTEARY